MSRLPMFVIDQFDFKGSVRGRDVIQVRRAHSSPATDPQWEFGDRVMIVERRPLWPLGHHDPAGAVVKARGRVSVIEDAGLSGGQTSLIIVLDEDTPRICIPIERDDVVISALRAPTAEEWRSAQLGACQLERRLRTALPVGEPVSQPPGPS